MLVTTSWIAKNYNKFNKAYFYGMLPPISFKISRARNTWGYASFRYDFVNSTIIPEAITLSNYYDSPEDVKIQTLLHEMIHIADYTLHPEHFIRNGKKVRGNYYDPHGYWFRAEANRIQKESGYQIAKHVTKDEIGRSSLSVRSQKLMENKIQNARIVVASNGPLFWIFKTNISNIDNVISLIKRDIPEYYKITEYSFINESLANRRSCSTKLSGWHLSKFSFMQFAEKNKLTTLKSYHI